jgi:formate hydrogenlyase subunit 3/multisubunit Na+/H+ antiporter MnhD subunit
VLYLDTLLDMRGVAKAIWVLGAATACAAVFGVGVPLFGGWVASQVQNAGDQGIGMLAAAVVILGPLASYFVLVAFVGRFRFSHRPDAEPQRMAWTRSRAEIRQRARYTTTFEEIVLTAVLIVGLGFEVWYFFFAHCPSAACFG